MSQGINYSTGLSSSYQDTDIDILYKEVKIIAYALQYYICRIREPLDVLTTNKITCNVVLYNNILRIWFNILGILINFYLNNPSPLSPFLPVSFFPGILHQAIYIHPCLLIICRLLVSFSDI